MTWVKMDDRYQEHPKIVGLGLYAEVGAHLNSAAISWCSRNLTDGRLPKVNVGRLAMFAKMKIDGRPVRPDDLARRLVDARLWEDDGDDYLIHDYLDYQPSRDAVLAQRASATARVQRHRERRGNGVTNAEPSANYHGTSPPPGPGPVPGSPKEEDLNGAGVLIDPVATADAVAARPTCENPPPGNHKLGIYSRACPIPDSYAYVPMIARIAMETSSGCTNPKLCFDEDMRLYYKRRAHDVRSWTPRWDLATRQWFLRHAQMGGACQRKATPVDRARSADERRRHEAAQRRTATPERPVTRAVAKADPTPPADDAQPTGGMESLGDLFRRLRMGPAAVLTPEEEEALRTAEGGDS